MKNSEKIDINKPYENIIYLEIFARGCEVQVRKLRDNYQWIFSNLSKLWVFKLLFKRFKF